MRELKAGIIGAGSTYTPELIEGFINRQENLNFQTFYLMDINEEKLTTVGGLVKRMFASKGFKGKLFLLRIWMKLYPERIMCLRRFVLGGWKLVSMMKKYR